jgi:hypothetical protein
MMTLTERNKQLQDLRTRLAWLRTEQLAVEESIKQVNRDYKDGLLFENESLIEQMFGSEYEAGIEY